MITYDPEELTAKGYTFADLEFAAPPAYPSQRRIAIRLNYPMNSLTYFRHSADSWGLWISPNAEKGFIEPGGLLSRLADLPG